MGSGLRDENRWPDVFKFATAKVVSYIWLIRV